MSLGCQEIPRQRAVLERDLQRLGGLVETAHGERERLVVEREGLGQAGVDRSAVDDVQRGPDEHRGTDGLLVRADLSTPIEGIVSRCQVLLAGKSRIR
jgi:hypothetical protein